MASLLKLYGGTIQIHHSNKNIKNTYTKKELKKKFNILNKKIKELDNEYKTKL